LYIANAGDSRAVLAKKTGTKIVAHELSVDHKPELAEERKRIEKAGGFVEDNRVRGILNLSRSLGDLEYKSDSTLHLKDQMITALPDIRKEKIGADTQFLILACDGIWDCLTSQEAVELVADLL
jgi:serine/threonine protein phosphatase PrpC